MSVEKIKELEEQLGERDRELAEMKRRERVVSNEAWFAERLREGKVLPAMKEAVMVLLGELSEEQTVTFAEKEGEEPKKMSAVELFKGLLGQMPVLIKFEEIATGDKVAEGGVDPDEFQKQKEKWPMATDEQILFDMKVEEYRKKYELKTYDEALAGFLGQPGSGE